MMNRKMQNYDCPSHPVIHLINRCMLLMVIFSFVCSHPNDAQGTSHHSTAIGSERERVQRDKPTSEAQANVLSLNTNSSFPQPTTASQKSLIKKQASFPHATVTPHHQISVESQSRSTSLQVTGHLLPASKWGLFHHLKMLALGTDPGYTVIDEFGKVTSVPFHNGNVNISNCVNAKYLVVDGTNVYNVDLNDTFLSIPDELQEIAKSWGLVVEVICKRQSGQRTKLQPPSGFVRRLAAPSGKCRENLDCGVPGSGLYEPPDLCLDGRLGTECHEYKTGFANYNSWGYIKKGAVCGSGSSIFIEYSRTSSGQKFFLLPGSMVLVTGHFEEVFLHIQEPLSLSCSVINKEEVHLGFSMVQSDATYIKVTKGQIKMDEILRVDCEVVDHTNTLIATTYFFLGDGQVEIDCEDDGSASCSVSDLLNNHNVTAIPMEKEGGVACVAEVKLCYPKEMAEKVESQVMEKCQTPVVTVLPTTVVTVLPGSDVPEVGDMEVTEKLSGMVTIMSVVGVLLLIIVVAMVFVFTMSRKKRKEKTAMSQTAAHGADPVLDPQNGMKVKGINHTNIITQHQMKSDSNYNRDSTSEVDVTTDINPALKPSDTNSIVTQNSCRFDSVIDVSTNEKSQAK